jgi:hypothetical protein
MNQQNHCEDNIQTESLADLEMTVEQAEQTQAGTGTHSTGGGGGVGKVAFQDLHFTTK